ncbi:MAG: PaaI family thioesterase [Rhodobacteraceae bacterium]|nr:PaaI family thioesterase [Paracoccaceae bacterium]
MTEDLFEPRFSAFAGRIRDSFAKQGLMETFGAHLASVACGRVVIEMGFSQKATQQHGFQHGGAIAAVLDSACGYAGLSVMAADSAVLTVEFKINFLAPADGVRFRFEGEVIKPGRTIVPADGRAYAIAADGKEKLIATMSCTLMAVQGRGLEG